MIIDLEKDVIPDEHKFDVCVVGAGAAGIALTVELARQGRSVVLLEAGGNRFEARSQNFCVGESTGLPYTGLYNGRCRALGGTTRLWGGQIMELDEHVFGERPGISGGQWPISKRDIADSYARAASLEGVRNALDDTDAIWRLLNTRPPDFGADLQSAFSRWCPQTDFAQLHAGTLRSHHKILVVLHANVCELQLTPDDHTVCAIAARTLVGRRVIFNADNIVLAVGGIEASRLLLQPLRNGRVAPWAAKNLVGKYFQDHISCFVATVNEDSLAAARYFDYLAVDGVKYHPKIKLRPASQARLGTLDVCGTIAVTADGIDDLATAYETYRLWQTRQLRSLTPARIGQFLLNAHRLIWHKSPYMKHLGRVQRRQVLRLCIHCEQMPQSAGRITLTSERDALGLLRARVNWKTSQLELHSIRAFINIIDRAFSAQRLGRIVPDAGIETDDAVLTATFRESFHHIGGTRMATSDSAGVVDPNLRLFGTRNVYVCSTSVFPSAGFANPTHTLLALAVRLADHLAGQPKY